MTSRRLLAALILGSNALLAACASGLAGTEIGVSRAAMSPGVRPGEDFYAFANGAWQRDTEIPADRSNVGAFYEAFIVTEARTAEMIDEIVRSDPAPGTDAARIKSFHQAYVDTAAIDAAGMTPIQADFDRFAGIADRADLSRVLGEQTRADVDPLNYTDFDTENLFGVFVTQGLATPGEVLPYLLQGGLGLPDREYYLSDDPDMAVLRAAYRAYVEEILVLAGFDDAAARAERVFDLETKIAEAHVPREQSEDMANSGTVWSRAELEANAPGIDWSAFLDAAQLGAAPRFAAYHAPAMPKLAALVASEPLQAWKDWLAFHQINSHADVLPTPIDRASFVFYGTTLSGTPQQRAREKRAIDAVNLHLGDAVGKAYVERWFPASARADVQAMVDEIKLAFADRIEAIDWMADETKAEALAKARGIVVGVGFPDDWRDYSGYDVSPTSAYANAIAGELAEYAHQRAKLGHPVDRTEWWMTPQTVNAVNLPVQNALNFPAAILQPPFFDAEADAAFNYGAIGAVIGHEISHSFDNNGAAFDDTGALRNWWTKADLASFRAQGDALARQYDAYEPLPGLHIDGALTLGENIADLAGLQAAYDAYRASLAGEEAPVIDGLTGDQRFFIAYAQTWATKMRDEALRQRVLTDGHAPGMYRALTVRNLDAWYAAFDVQAGDALYLPPEERVQVW